MVSPKTADRAAGQPSAVREQPHQPPRHGLGSAPGSPRLPRAQSGRCAEPQPEPRVRQPGDGPDLRVPRSRRSGQPESAREHHHSVTVPACKPTRRSIAPVPRARRGRHRRAAAPIGSLALRHHRARMTANMATTDARVTSAASAGSPRPRCHPRGYWRRSSPRIRSPPPRLPRAPSAGCWSSSWP